MTNETNFPRELVLAAGLAKPFESLFLKAYHDPVGYPTIGYGHLLSYNKWEDLSKYPDVSEQEAERLLVIDLNKAAGAVRYNVKYPINVNQRAALIDFTFNLGPGNLRISTLLKMINRGELDQAAEQFMRWNRAGGKIYRGLTRRRLAEKNLFLTGV